jgi:hypothetical protein
MLEGHKTAPRTKESPLRQTRLLGGSLCPWEGTPWVSTEDAPGLARLHYRPRTNSIRGEALVARRHHPSTPTFMAVLERFCSGAFGVENLRLPSCSRNLPTEPTSYLTAFFSPLCLQRFLYPLTKARSGNQQSQRRPSSRGSTGRLPTSATTTMRQLG